MPMLYSEVAPERLALTPLNRTDTCRRPVIADYASRKGIGVSPISSKARRWVSVGSARRSKVTVVPGTLQVFRVNIARWSRSPWNGRSVVPSGCRRRAAFLDA